MLHPLNNSPIPSGLYMLLLSGPQKCQVRSFCEHVHQPVGMTRSVFVISLSWRAVV
jgi:hypothetical protein